MSLSAAATATISEDEEHKIAAIRLLLEKDHHVAQMMRKAEWTKRDILRFLRAKRGNVDDAAVKARNYLCWVNSEKISQICIDDVRQELETGKIVLLGEDCEKRPVVLIRARLHYPHDKGEKIQSFPREKTVELFVFLTRTIVLDMMKREENEEIEQFVLVIDLAGFSMANHDRGIGKELGGMFAKYFPGRLHKLILINAPFIVRGLWAMIRPLVAARWLETIAFFKSPTLLFDFIARENLPLEYGGDVKLDWQKAVEVTIDSLTTKQILSVSTLAGTRQVEQQQQEQQLSFTDYDGSL